MFLAIGLRGCMSFSIFDSASNLWPRLCGRALAVLGLLLLVGTAHGQQTAQAPPGDVREVLTQIRDELRDTRAELANAQRQIEELTTEVQRLREGLATRPDGPRANSQSYASPADTPAASAPQRSTGTLSATQLQENQTLLQEQVEEQHQTKVESASKYRVKISGLVLMNAFSNRGAFDKADVPNRALSSYDYGSVGATLRQSVLALQVFGPDLAGAHTSANASVDFFGGFPQQPFGATAGIVRLRQASAHLDWSNTSVILGQETPFISPLSPTSYATIAEPALAWSGNLWAWTPQAVVERRFVTSEESYVSLSGGFLAPLTEDVPNYLQAGYIGPGERARRPAFGSRIGWHSQAFGDTVEFGLGGYASRLRYGIDHDVDSWAVTSYWQFPLGSHVQFSGEAYRGRAVGGLGGGIAQSIVYSGDPRLPAATFRPLNAAGGWAQLKLRPLARWETNFAFGQDNVFSRDLRWAPSLQGEYMTPLARNRAAFGNVIFHPRSNLLLSAEYRKIWTYGYVGPVSSGDQINLGAGVSF